jgi:ABC-type sugar transport system permease subunit
MLISKLKLIRKYWLLYIFISIFTVISLVFGIYPMISSVYYSFFKGSTILTSKDFVGLSNYLNLFQDEYFWNSFKITVGFSIICVPLNIAVALLLSALLNYRGVRHGLVIFKLAVFIPYITPDVVGAVVWKQVFNTNGAMNSMLSIIGLGPVQWLTSPGFAISVLAFVELWKHVGLYTIIFLTNYQLIDRTMYEAATIDGASALQSYRFITIPSLRPALVLNGTYAAIQFLKTFTVAKIITFGGPNFSTNFLSYYAYSKYERMNFGSATAIATFLFLFILLVIYAGRKFAERRMI